MDQSELILPKGNEQMQPSDERPAARSILDMKAATGPDRLRYSCDSDAREAQSAEEQKSSAG